MDKYLNTGGKESGHQDFYASGLLMLSPVTVENYGDAGRRPDGDPKERVGHRPYISSPYRFTETKDAFGFHHGFTFIRYSFLGNP